MPYEVVKEGDKYIVRKEGTTDVVSSFDTEKDAKEQVQALYANEPEMKAGQRHSQNDMQHLQDIRSNAESIIASLDTIGANKPKEVFIKTLPDGSTFVSGYGILFDTQDLVGDTFTSNTDYGLERSFENMPVFYDHTVKGVKSRIGKVNSVFVDDVGIKFEIELDKHNKYIEEIQKLLAAKVLGLSTGALGHTVIRNGGTIKRWLVGEISLTPTPCESKTIRTIVSEVKDVEGDKGMSEGTEGTTEFSAFAKRIDGMESQLNTILEAMANAKPDKNIKGFAVDGEDSQPTVKTFGDWLLSVYRDDTKRLKTVYKTLGEQSGDVGGYTVPQEFLPQLLRATREASVIEPLARVLPMQNRTLDIPALNNTGTYVAGQSQFYGGVKFVSVAEGDTISSTEPNFKQVTLTAHKQAGYTEVTSELMTDSPITIESVITELVSGALAYRKDWLFLNGNGNGEPLGVFNSACRVSVDLTDATPTLLEFSSMRSKLIPSSYGKAVWLVNPLLAHLIFSLNTYAVSYMPNLQGQPTMQFMGLPVKISEAMPSTIATGGIMLADFSYYLVGQKPSISIMKSEHVGFKTDTIVWRFISRFDGQCWLDSTIKIGSGATDVVTPFVTSM